MERAPLPPHERSWRHPSELAADARRTITDERASTTARTAALTGGTATILLVGIVVFSLTPRGPGNPSAMRSSPVERIAIASLTVPHGSTPAAPPATPPASIPASTTATDVVPSTTAIPVSVQSTVPPQPTPRPRPLVTEVGSDGLAVLPSRAVVELAGPGASSPTSIVVTRQGGSIAMASVVDAGDGSGLAIVHLSGTDTGVGSDGGYQVADESPAHHDMVTVMTDDPVSVELGGLGSVEVADLDDLEDGIAVLDADGHLVGLYIGDDTDDGSGGRLILIDAALGDATATAD